MRYRKLLFYMTTVVVFFICVARSGFALTGGWEEMTSGIDKTLYLSCIEGTERTDALYVGTNDGVYRTVDFGKHWVRISLPGKETGVTRVALSEGIVYISTESGLYERKCGKWNWSPGKQYLYGVAAGIAGGEHTVLVWSKTEIFLIEPNGWKRIDPRTPGKKLEDVVIKNGIIYAAAGNKLFYSRDRGNAWDRYFVCRDAGEEFVDDNSSIANEEKDRIYPAIRRIDNSGPFGVAVATGAGVFLFRDGSNFVEKVNTTGLPSSLVNYALNTKEGLFAATGVKVFLRTDNDPSGYWRTVFENSATGDIVWLKVLIDAHGKEWLWVVTDRSIYRKSMGDIVEESVVPGKPKKIVTSFSQEPTILAVQNMAIAYAEVSPEKIRKWREGAKWKAIMPRVSLSFSESNDENIEIYKSASNSYVVRGPNESDKDWSIGLTWDLADVIWNPSQTSIDVRSKLMVQLRDDILEEVTRLYFERKRLIVAMEVDMDSEMEYVSTKTREQMIRVNELTAYIDAFTGGGFSAAMEQKGPN